MKGVLPLKSIINIRRTTSNAVLEKRILIAAVIAVIITAILTITKLTQSTTSSATSLLCSSFTRPEPEPSTPLQLDAILHYATSSLVPQQSIAEITVSFRVLRSLAPCNFLVYGLGHDSLMWASLNPRGTTLFLEEDIQWVHKTLRNAPLLRVHAVRYDTRLSDADDLLSSYKKVKECMPPAVTLRGNERCRLALSELPEEVYRKEWDAIMIDAPRGYFAAAPGRMAVIFSAAVMARHRKRAGVTHVFVHDVNRNVEKSFAEEFLCMKYLAEAEGRLWHFVIPPVKTNDRSRSFC